MEMKIPKVLECDVSNCAYNNGGKCHTLGITVGGPEPYCDTFVAAETIKGGMRDVNAEVGACKVQGCRFNKMLECSISGIHVKKLEGCASCATFVNK